MNLWKILYGSGIQHEAFPGFYFKRGCPFSSFLIQSSTIKNMDDIHFYEKPWFISLVLAVFLAGIYIYEIFWQGGVENNMLGIAFDILMLVLLFQLCVFFYAQFVLPINKLTDRNKIVRRLWQHVTKSHGPAIFVKNGRLVESPKESEKKGPGVLWLDTASAVVTRTPTAFKNVLLPGVHFTDRDEQVATIISLHTQMHRIGPLEEEDPFGILKDNASDEEKNNYREIQERRMTVSAMTRDGIEVVPNISVVFKIDAKPAKPGEKGSRFGFNMEAVEKAARGEGINASSTADEPRHVAWNQLPALIAADLWREYLSKFTLNELFSPILEPLPEVPQPDTSNRNPEPVYLAKPIRYGFFSAMLRSINNSLEKRLPNPDPVIEPIPAENSQMDKPAPGKKPTDAKPQTALQIINQVMRARMTQIAVPILDESGRPVEGYTISNEYRKLREERGLVILNVSVSGLRLAPPIENQLVQQWNTSWLANAKADRSRIERLSLAYNENGRQKALQDHAVALSQSVLKERPRNIAAALKALLQRTQSEIKLNDGLLRRTTNEVDDLDDIINWVESKEL